MDNNVILLYLCNEKELAIVVGHYLRKKPQKLEFNRGSSLRPQTVASEASPNHTYTCERYYNLDLYVCYHRS